MIHFLKLASDLGYGHHSHHNFSLISKPHHRSCISTPPIHLHGVHRYHFTFSYKLWYLPVEAAYQPRYI